MSSIPKGAITGISPSAIVLFIITGFLISNLFIGKMINYIPKLVLDFTQLYLDPKLRGTVLTYQKLNRRSVIDDL